MVAGGGRSAALKFGRRRPLLLQISANPRQLAVGGGWGRKRTSSRSFWYRPRPQSWSVAGVTSRDVVFDEKTMFMNIIKKVKENVVGKKKTINVPLKKVFRETSQEQPTKKVQEEVESDTEVEEIRQQQQTQDGEE
ncbi:hypothetical protein L3X38_042855 [Prunus dulcis]|uniref:Uncharacterized protein n=2 Tax=Prunus dulcis TaxID=3755 RepID=A0AAD4UVR0_PRUDU|nr:hypothetical protein L3X38_042855 [Prunus dulcis]